MYQNNFLRKPACHGHNLHLGTEPQVPNSSSRRMNTPNTRPITSSLALNRLGSLCMRELVGLCHDALIWKTSKKLLKFKTQDQGWRDGCVQFDEMVKILTEGLEYFHSDEKNLLYPVACRPT